MTVDAALVDAEEIVDSDVVANKGTVECDTDFVVLATTRQSFPDPDGE